MEDDPGGTRILRSPCGFSPVSNADINLQNTLSPCRESLMAGMDRSVMDYILANKCNYLKLGE